MITRNEVLADRKPFPAARLVPANMLPQASCDHYHVIRVELRGSSTRDVEVAGPYASPLVAKAQMVKAAKRDVGSDAHIVKSDDGFTIVASEHPELLGERYVVALCDSPTCGCTQPLESLDNLGFADEEFIQVAM